VHEEEPQPVSPCLRLFCVPFAGGNAYSYKDLKKHLAGFVELVALELPGRGRRFGEPLLTCLDEMVADLHSQIRGQASGSCALYGHSMGGRLVALVARRMLQEGTGTPAHLFVSGCPAPSAVRPRRRHLLPRDEFISMLHQMDCPPEVLRNEELMEVFEPVLRADFEANDTFQHRPQTPLHVPITAMLGTSDETTREEVLRWQEETTTELSVQEFDGGHFFIFDHLPALGRIISEGLEAC
jgi:surfactin synthase thioesterase subunit